MGDDMDLTSIGGYLQLWRLIFGEAPSDFGSVCRYEKRLFSGFLFALQARPGRRSRK